MCSPPFLLPIPPPPNQPSNYLRYSNTGSNLRKKPKLIIIIVIGRDLLALIMPTVTITMSEKAYDIYRTWVKGDRSNKVSHAILQTNAMKSIDWDLIRTVKE